MGAFLKGIGRADVVIVKKEMSRGKDEFSAIKGKGGKRERV